MIQKDKKEYTIYDYFIDQDHVDNQFQIENEKAEKESEIMKNNLCSDIIDTEIEKYQSLLKDQLGFKQQKKIESDFFFKLNEIIVMQKVKFRRAIYIRTYQQSSQNSTLIQKKKISFQKRFFLV